jgi:hypothetical protein
VTVEFMVRERFLALAAGGCSDGACYGSIVAVEAETANVSRNVRIDALPQKEASMITRSLGVLRVLKSPLIVAATLLLAIAATPTLASEPKNGTRNERANSGDDGPASGSSSAQRAAGTTPNFAWPASISSDKRCFLDQKGKVYLLKTMSSWAMAQNYTNAEITTALEGLKALGFNAVTVSPFGVHMNDSFGDRYKNKAGQRFFTDAPYASPFGPAWSSMDWIMSEATRLQMTVVFSLFMSWGNTGSALDLAKAATTNAYTFGKTVATRYAGYPNIVWHRAKKLRKGGSMEM